MRAARGGGAAGRAARADRSPPSRVHAVGDAGARCSIAGAEDPATDLYELRDPGLLKLFCGADPARLAETQLEQHEQRLELYRSLHEHEEMPHGMRLALESGIGHEREYVRFWSRLRDGEPAVKRAGARDER